jgi:hypothetical protein
MRRVVNIAVASPGDVAGERDAVAKVFTEWNSANNHAILLPLMWESAATPEMGSPPQDIVNKSIIDKSDLLVAILWSKLGTPTLTERSGTVEEIQEFIKHKGPRRVMLYFCRRELPNDVNPDELGRLREFEKEMKTKGLFSEYTTVAEFRGDLYRHLDVKVQQFIDNELPLPDAGLQAAEDCNLHPDARLRKCIDFGDTLEAIAKGFAARMDEFDRIHGWTNDKFLDLAAYVYSSCAWSLDRFLKNSRGTLKSEDYSAIVGISFRLKGLAGKCDEYNDKPFPLYWKDGRLVSNDLIAQVKHMGRMARS